MGRRWRNNVACRQPAIHHIGNGSPLDDERELARSDVLLEFCDLPGSFCEQIGSIGVAEAIVGEFRFLSDPQQAGRCAVDDILVDDLFGDDLKRSEEHTSELQSLMRISYAVFYLQKKYLYIFYF